MGLYSGDVCSEPGLDHRPVACSIFSVSSFIVKKDDDTHTASPGQHTCRDNLVIQVDTIISAAEKAPLSDRSLANYSIFN